MIIYRVTSEFKRNYKDNKDEYVVDVFELSVEKETSKTYIINGSNHCRRVLKSEMDRLVEMFGSDIGYYCFENELELAKRKVVEHTFNKLYTRKVEIEMKLNSIKEYESINYKPIRPTR